MDLYDWNSGNAKELFKYDNILTNQNEFQSTLRKEKLYFCLFLYLINNQYVSSWFP